MGLHKGIFEVHEDTKKCATQILDAKYNKADLQSTVRNICKHLSADHQNKLLHLPMKYELLFSGTLGDWKTKPASFQLKEQNTIPWPSFPSAKRTQGYLHQRS
jgi:hypothetical protein